MTFKYECLSYEIVLSKEFNIPIAIAALYKDGQTERSTTVPFESRHLIIAIQHLKDSLGGEGEWNLPIT